MTESISIQETDAQTATDQLAYFKGSTEPVDDSSFTDNLKDPIKETTEKFYSMGSIIKGHGEENGAYINFGGYRLPNILAPAEMCLDEVYGAVSFDAVQQIYTNPATSSSLFKGSIEPFFGPTLSPRDGNDHTAHRAVMQRGFTPKQIQNYKDAVARPVLKRRFSQLKGKGHADLYRELNALYPFEIIGKIVGYDYKDIEHVADCFDRIWQGNTDINAALQAGTELKDYARQLINKRRQEPKEDYVSALLSSEVDGESLDETNLVGLVNHLLSGGIETTSRQTNMLIFDLLNHPDQLALLKNDRKLISGAVEESLRYDGIGAMVCRNVLEDIEVCGTKIPKDSVVFTFHLAANRDPSHWENPHTFDITRPIKRHQSFATGAHMCIGQHFARFMMSEYLEHILDDMPNLRWNPEVDTPQVVGWSQRSPTSLPVVWDVVN